MCYLHSPLFSDYRYFFSSLCPDNRIWFSKTLDIIHSPCKHFSHNKPVRISCIVCICSNPPPPPHIWSSPIPLHLQHPFCCYICTQSQSPSSLLHLVLYCGLVGSQIDFTLKHLDVVVGDIQICS